MLRVIIPWAQFGALLAKQRPLLHQKLLHLHLLHQLLSSVLNLLSLHHQSQKKGWLLFSKKLVLGSL
uniref:Uncharacterized protein n=1 Tax=Populus trichocarpa TaxID=3694 RepID=A9PEM0_POPTR|nr:unknown [Populus trichocarpa]